MDPVVDFVNALSHNMPAPYSITSAVVGGERILLEVRDLTETEPAQRTCTSAWDESRKRWVETIQRGLTARTRPGHDVEIGPDDIAVSTRKACPKRLLAAVQTAISAARQALAERDAA